MPAHDVATGDDERHAARDEGHAQRHDERGHAQLGDDDAADEAEGSGRGQGGHEAGDDGRHLADYRLATRTTRRLRRHDRRKAHDPAHREVDAARDDDERLAQAHEQDRDDGAQDDLRVAQGEEVDVLRDVDADREEGDEPEEEDPGPARLMARMSRLRVSVGSDAAGPRGRRRFGHGRRPFEQAWGALRPPHASSSWPWAGDVATRPGR